VRAERISKEARAQVMREQISEGKELAIPSTLGAADSRSRYDYINKLKTALMEYEVQKEQFQQKYTQNHPKMKELLIAIQESREKLQEEIREILEEEEANIKALRSAEAAIVQRMNTVAASISDISEKQYELGQMTIGVNDLEAVLSMLVRQREEAHIAAQERAHLVQVRLLQPASVPRDLVWPNRPLLIGLGLVLAFIVAFGSAFFVEYFDHSVNTVEDAQHCLGLPILAVIPEAARVDKASDMPSNKARRPY
jgi:tyrosine-protein kinase Etk/Wzc